MWRDHVLPRLVARGLGADRAVETLRLSGIGESLLVDAIGEDVLRRRNPEVATYARVDAVDIRVSASAEGGRTARELVDEQVARLMPALGRYVFARGDDGWPAAIRERLAGRTVAIAESGTAGQLVALLGSESWLTFDETTGPIADAASAGEAAAAAGAVRVRQTAGADVGLCVLARDTDGDMAVAIAMTDGSRSRALTQTAFLGGDQGRRRAANLACTELWRWLGRAGGRAGLTRGGAGPRSRRCLRARRVRARRCLRVRRCPCAARRRSTAACSHRWAIRPPRQLRDDHAVPFRRVRWLFAHPGEQLDRRNRRRVIQTGLRWLDRSQG